MANNKSFKFIIYDHFTSADELWIPDESSRTLTNVDTGKAGDFKWTTPKDGKTGYIEVDRDGEKLSLLILFRFSSWGEKSKHFLI